jgi:hypothetical protein
MGIQNTLLYGDLPHIQKGAILYINPETPIPRLVLLEKNTSRRTDFVLHEILR